MEEIPGTEEQTVGVPVAGEQLPTEGNPPPVVVAPEPEPEEPPGPEVPAGVTITSEQEEQREALMQALAGAPIGSIPSDLFPKYLLLRAEGYNVDEIASRSNQPLEVLRQGEEEFVSWLTGGLGREARVLFQADPNLWRFLRYYYHA